MCEPKQQAWAFSENQRGEIVLTEQAHQLTSGGGKPGQGYPAVLLSEASSQGSEEWTTDSHEPDSTMCSSAREEATPTELARSDNSGPLESGDEPCSPTTGPESPSTRTLGMLGERNGATDPQGEPGDQALRSLSIRMNQTESWGDPITWDATETLEASQGMKQAVFTFSAAASPAKTSQSPANAEDSQANDPGSSLSSPESSTLFDPDSFSSRTYPVSSLQMAVGTSEQSLERWPTSGTAWAGGFSTHVTSECRSDDDGCSSSEPPLTEILEPPQNVAARYSLSARAAQGILRRAQKGGRELPAHLRTALERVGETTTTDRDG